MPDREARRDQRIDQVRQIYALAGAGEWAAVEERLTEDFCAIEADHLPFGGTYPGRRGLHDLFVKVMGMSDVADMQVHDIAVGEDHAIALVDLVYAGGGRARIAEMFRFRGDRICEIRPFYFDPAPVIASIEAKRAALAGR